MATSGLYGQATNVGGTYFQWSIFQQTASVPTTPIGGSWNFTTNVGTPPTPWLNAPPGSGINNTWVSIAFVDSRNPTTFTWSTPVIFAVAQVGTGTVTSSGFTNTNGFTGVVANPSTTPNLTLSTSASGMLKGVTGALTAATVGTDYSVGTSALATGIVKSITGTGALSIATAGIDYLTSSYLTSNPLSIAQGGTGQSLASAALTALGGAASGANTDISSLASPALAAATATTATTADSTIKVATTAFVQGELTSQAVKLTGAQTIAGVKTFTGAVDLPGNLINNTAAGADVALLIGQTAYVDVSSATSALLHITTGDNQLYEITCAMLGASAVAASSTNLLPNNSNYANFFKVDITTESGAVNSALGAYANTPYISYTGDPRFIKATVSTKTTSKWVASESNAQVAGPQSYSSRIHSIWQASASSSGAGDTTTAWTSLGTINFPVATSGRIYIKRVA